MQLVRAQARRERERERWRLEGANELLLVVFLQADELVCVWFLATRLLTYLCACTAWLLVCNEMRFGFLASRCLIFKCGDGGYRVEENC